jgi:hypothetical protein
MTLGKVAFSKNTHKNEIKQNDTQQKNFQKNDR